MIKIEFEEAASKKLSENEENVCIIIVTIKIIDEENCFIHNAELEDELWSVVSESGYEVKLVISQ